MEREPIHQIFRAALAQWVKQRGWGAQAEISRNTQGTLSPSQINDLLKGRRYGTEEQRRLICSVIGMDYEQFLDRGRELLELKSGDEKKRILPFQNKLVGLGEHSEERAMRISSIVGKEIGWPEFPDWLRSLPKGKNPPGWKNYLRKKLDDYGLYERIREYALSMKESL